MNFPTASGAEFNLPDFPIYRTHSLYLAHSRTVDKKLNINIIERSGSFSTKPLIEAE